MNVRPMTLEALEHLAPPMLRRDKVGPDDLEALRDSYSYVLRFSLRDLGAPVEILVTRESGQHYRLAPAHSPERYEMVRTWKAARLAIEAALRREKRLAVATREAGR